VRRYVFHLKPVIVQQSTSYYDEVRYLTEVTASRTLSGTGLVTVIRDVQTGRQLTLCNSGDTCGVMGYMGKTYRATVETSDGELQGPGAVWTYTADGLREDNVDALDLAWLASKFVDPDALCERLVSSPVQTYALQPPSTLSDQYRTCKAGVTAGKGVLEILHEISATDGDGSLLWWLDGDTRRQAPADGTGDRSDAIPPPPSPASGQAVKNLADVLMDKNPSLDQDQADRVAAMCIWLTSRASRNAYRDCGALPIFAEGNDITEKTDHDLVAIARRPRWVQLNYMASAEQAGSPGWYGSADQCKPAEPGKQCDEYPFYSSEQGGPNAAPPVDLMKIAEADNMYGGNRYSVFLSACKMKSLAQKQAAGDMTATHGDAFLTIPIPPEWGVPTKTDLCNGKT